MIGPPRDHLLIADVIIKSGADVMGLQEIENKEALDLVLRYLDDYDGYIIEGDAPQNVGVVFKKDVVVDSVQIYTPLQLDRPDRLRPGFVVKCRKGAFEWVQLVVHFKSTSRYDSTSTLQDLSRTMRSGQARVASAWADSVIASGQPNVLIPGRPQRLPSPKAQPHVDATCGERQARVPDSRNDKLQGSQLVIDRSCGGKQGGNAKAH